MPAGLEGEAVVEALRHGWDFEATAAEYLPVGAGSYHWVVADAAGARRFVTVDGLDWKTWLGDTRDASFHGLRRAFDTAVALRAAGLDFVVGRAAEFGAHEEEMRRPVLAMLADLHRATPAAAGNTAGLELPGRNHVEAALRDVDVPWTGGPLSEPARAAIREGAGALAELLALSDRLAAEARSNGGAWVVTHGEPHAANIMRTSDGCRLVDWDTVALAPPERDLWMLVARHDEEAADDYFRATRRPIDQVALDYFRLMWELKDLAEYLNALRAPHEEDEDTERQYRSLLRIGAIREAWHIQSLDI